MVRAGIRRSQRLSASASPFANSEVGRNATARQGRKRPVKVQVEPLKEIENIRERSPKAKKTKKVETALPKTYEQRLWKSGHARVAGVDEAGRGPLAGPVVAAACIITEDVGIPRIADSKTLSEATRESLYEQLIAHPNVQYGIGIESAASVDSINILQATYRAMEAAVQNLPEPSPCAVLIDGNRTPPHISARHVETIVHGDSKCYSIAAASIIAKVTRDRMMHEAHARWPEYGFAAHKGYGTKAHMEAVRRLGPCEIHRLTFRPLPEIVEAAKEAAGSR